MAHSDSEAYDHLVKVLMIGESGVGKTNLIQRFTRNQFSQNHLATIAVDFRMKVIDTGTARLKMQIWDTAGQERFDTLTTGFFKGADGIVVVYSVTDRHSLDRVNKWLLEIEAHAPATVKLALVGNKVDLQNERAVSRDEGAALAEKHYMPFVETSAKTGEGVQEAFVQVAKALEPVTRTQRTESSVGGEALGRQGPMARCCGSG